MKNISRSSKKTKRENGLRAEYRFDYRRSKPNRLAKRIQPGAVAGLLDRDVARVFHSAETVNGVLRVARGRRGNLDKICAWSGTPPGLPAHGLRGTTRGGVCVFRLSRFPI
jgi:hypothetical protein